LPSTDNRQTLIQFLQSLILHILYNIFEFQFKLFFLPILAYFLFTGKRKLVLSTIIGFVCFLFTSIRSQVFKTQDVALSEVFWDADTVIRKTLFLNSEQLEQLQKISKSKFDSRIITYYAGLKNGEELGIAFFEAQIVRTKKAIIIIMIFAGINKTKSKKSLSKYVS